MKKILALALVCVLALAVLASCAKKEEPKAEQSALVSYTVYNRTGEKVKELTLADTRSDKSWSFGGIADGTSIGVSVDAVLDDTGTPSLTLGYTTETVNGGGVIINQKIENITLLPGSVEFTAPAEEKTEEKAE